MPCDSDKPKEPERCNDIECDEVLAPGRTGLCPMCEYDYAHMAAASEAMEKAMKKASENDPKK